MSIFRWYVASENMYLSPNGPKERQDDISSDMLDFLFHRDSFESSNDPSFRIWRCSVSDHVLDVHDVIVMSLCQGDDIDPIALIQEREDSIGFPLSSETIHVK